LHARRGYILTGLGDESAFLVPNPWTSWIGTSDTQRGASVISVERLDSLGVGGLLAFIERRAHLGIWSGGHERSSALASGSVGGRESYSACETIMESTRRLQLDATRARTLICSLQATLGWASG